ncbi:FAD-dependent oxidoreductase [Paenibacillus ginsengarvi]|uniref:FAD-dependent oxidoreductase n=1 Tax=Paenibacillus ginsengarvi TaxID=400777 RepID=A0A3B0CGS4_9BACL|nr:FAD-dependent oxidoreductase [Paenibacillus ginsengarvi]RKN83924.1 FAD-dependent oxidoreductase [Paenibacillus ginsengarvi]
MTDFTNLRYYTPAEKLERPELVSADLCIYGGTPAGIAAAVQASRMGLSVVIAEFGRHLGGLTASGLGRTDFGRKYSIGGIAREFYQELGRHYGTDEEDGTAWFMEPHVAEAIFNGWMEKAGVPVYFGQHLAQVEKRDGRIEQITMENGNVFRAGAFIDATYEGDLFARAGVSYHVGREANTVYRETWNGIQFGSPHHTFRAWVDPFVLEGKPDSGLLHGISAEAPGVQGQGDRSIQAYNFRICLTDREDNKVAFPAPPNYDPAKFTLLSRYLRAGVWDALTLHKPMPNAKTDLNNFGGVSTDHIGMNHEWPEGDYSTRERIFQEHVHHNLGLLYFLANDESVPRHIRDEARKWGLPADEFTSTANWPHYLYVREGRRMIGDVVMNQNHCLGYHVADDSIGLASYGMDSHNCRRLVMDGRCVNEGDVEIGVPGPYPVSYRAIVPKGDECTNLLVPVCLSSSHIAYGSIRMEPVFMVLGQSAATAAAIALAEGRAVQDVDYAVLRQRLLQDGQALTV